MLKKSLHFLLAKLAYTKKVEKAKKHSFFKEIKAVFAMTDAEFNDLYKVFIVNKNVKSHVTSGHFFESRVLENIMNRLTMGKAYVMEAMLLKRDGSRVLQYYMKEQYLSEKFFMRSQAAASAKEQADSAKCVLEALRFLNQEVKGAGWSHDQTGYRDLEQSDFAICFLESFDQILSPLNPEKNQG